MDEPIRVLRIIARLNVGGPALHVSYLTRGLDDRGYETTLVAGTVGPEEGSMDYVARELGVEPVFIQALQREIAAVHDASAVRQLRSLMRELRPHVVHTHTAKAGALGRIAAASARLTSPPVVVHTFHGHVLHGYFGRAQTAAFLRVEKALARRTDRLIAVSPEVRDELVGYGIAPPEKFEVIRLGLDLESRAIAAPGARELERAKLGVASDRLLVGWFGRMTEIKRVDKLLAAFARLEREDVRAELVLAGDGPLRDELERLAHELGIAGRTHFLGMQQDVASLYAACDVVALTSANEGTPVSLIEAIAAGTAAVSTDVGGVRDVIADGRTGILVPAGDSDAMARALATLARDETLRTSLARAGREEVLRKYAVRRLLDDVDDLYRRLLAEQSSAASRVGRLTPALPPVRVASAERRLRILLLSQYFPPEIGATQSRMQAFAEYLSARGHRVTVICEFPNHPHGVIPAAYRGHVYEDDRSNPYRVLRVWVKASSEKTQRTRMQFYLSYMALATAIAPLAGRVDVVFATSPPLFTGLAGFVLARLNAAPFVLDVRDLWPAAAVSLDQIPSRRAAAAGERIERFLYRRAAAVTAVTAPFCDHIDRIRQREPGAFFLPNGTLEIFFDADVASRPTRADLGLPSDRFIVMFAGNFGIAQALPSVVEAAALSPDELHFVLIGDGPVHELVLRKIKARGLDNVTLLPQRPLDEIPSLLAVADALLVPLSGHPTFADFVPSKLIDYMATGKPVLLSANGEAVRILEHAHAGVAVAPEDPEALVDGARKLRDDPAEAALMGRHGREFARTQLRSEQASRLEELLVELTLPLPADA